MRKWIYLWTVVCTALVACDVETSDNGRLDGYWHLTGVDTLATSGHRDVSARSPSRLQGLGLACLCKG